MDKQREDFEKSLKKMSNDLDYLFFDEKHNNYIIQKDLTSCEFNIALTCSHTVNLSWELWQQAQKVVVPDGFVLVKKRNMIGNPNVDWLQAPKWARYWLKDGHSNKCWWSSIRPVKDMDLNAFCWKGDYFAEEAPSFNFSGSWDKSLTSRKAMIEAQEQDHENN